MLECLKQQDKLVIKGALTQFSLARSPNIQQLLAGFSIDIVVDLSAVEKVDTAGVSFLLELKECAGEKKLEISFEGATNSLKKLKSLYNLDTII